MSRAEVGGAAQHRTYNLRKSQVRRPSLQTDTAAVLMIAVWHRLVERNSIRCTSRGLEVSYRPIDARVPPCHGPHERVVVESDDLIYRL